MEPREIVLAYQEACNAHNIDLALSFFAPDIRYEMVGIRVMQGLDDLRSYAEWNQFFNTQLNFGKLQMKSNRLECQAEETNAWLEMVGLDSISYDSIKFEFKDGQISQVRAKLSPKSEMAMDRATNQVIRWVLDTDADVIDKIIPRGLFKYSKEVAERWLALLKEWKAHTTE